MDVNVAEGLLHAGLQNRSPLCRAERRDRSLARERRLPKLTKKTDPLSSVELCDVLSWVCVCVCVCLFDTEAH